MRYNSKFWGTNNPLASVKNTAELKSLRETLRSRAFNFGFFLSGALQAREAIIKQLHTLFLLLNSFFSLLLLSFFAFVATFFISFAFLRFCFFFALFLDPKHFFSLHFRNRAEPFETLFCASTLNQISVRRVISNFSFSSSSTSFTLQVDFLPKALSFAAIFRWSLKSINALCFRLSHSPSKKVHFSLQK